MANQIKIKNPIIIPKEAVVKEGIVILPLREYQKRKEEIEKLKNKKEYLSPRVKDFKNYC
jgi:hypothetical protein